MCGKKKICLFYLPHVPRAQNTVWHLIVLHKYLSYELILAELREGAHILLCNVSTSLVLEHLHSHKIFPLLCPLMILTLDSHTSTVIILTKVRLRVMKQFS